MGELQKRINHLKSKYDLRMGYSRRPQDQSIEDSISRQDALEIVEEMKKEQNGRMD